MVDLKFCAICPGLAGLTVHAMWYCDIEKQKQRDVYLHAYIADLLLFDYAAICCRMFSSLVMQMPCLVTMTVQHLTYIPYQNHSLRFATPA